MSNLEVGVGGSKSIGLSIISVLEFHTARKMIGISLKCDIRGFPPKRKQVSRRRWALASLFFFLLALARLKNGSIANLF